MRLSSVPVDCVSHRIDAVYVHRLLKAGFGYNWSIFGATVLKHHEVCCRRGSNRPDIAQAHRDPDMGLDVMRAMGRAKLYLRPISRGVCTVEVYRFIHNGENVPWRAPAT